MAGAKSELFQDRGVAMNMSPMIDMVFLLLIFFMVSSRLITIRKDQNVRVPIASQGEVPEAVSGRVVLNIYADGTIRDESGTETLSVREVEDRMYTAKVRNPKVKLHLRPHRGVKHKSVKRVVDASSRAGVNEVILSVYTTAKGEGVEFGEE